MNAATGARRIILVADDYAMTEGVSAGIERLAGEDRLSATSAIVTSPHWPAHAPRIAAFRDRIAVGLHVNLTLGRPLGSMARLAPEGTLPDIAAITKAAIRADLDRNEIAGEIARQIDAFVRHLGFAPDFIDGHQHVHSFPVIRDALLAALGLKLPDQRVLVRDPAMSLAAIAALGRAAPKAAVIAWLARGFGATASQLGFPVNDAFAGISDFKPETAASDLARARTTRGDVVIVMCHPGIPDEELARLDPLTTRRQAELDVLSREHPFSGALWQPARAPNGPAIDWRREFGIDAR